MTIKDLCKEKSLWRGKPDPMAAMKYKLFSPFTAFLLFGLLPAIPLLMSKHTKAFTMGVMLVVFLIARIVQSIMSYFAAKNTHYCISEKNIYIQTGIDGGEETICRPIEYFHTIEIEEVKYNLGTVICGYGKDSGYQSYKLELLPDYQTAYDLIQQIRDHQSMSEATEQKEPVRSEVPSFPEDLLIQRIPPPPPSCRTPDDVFFGNMDQSYLRRKKRGKFLNPNYIGEYEFPDELPQESVADLQAELFGANSELTGAFPDPTVNPLPEFPEDSDDQFMQQEQ